MPPRSRRMRARQEAAEAEEEFESAVAEGGAALEPAEGGTSRVSRGTSRRTRGGGGTGRSSRRAAAASGRASKRTSARKELSPEEKAARRAAIRNTFLTVLIILIVGGGGAGAYFALKEEPQQLQIEVMGESRPYIGTRAELAHQFMTEATNFERGMEKALRARQPDEAKANLDAMVVLLSQPVLGGGVAPNPEDPNIGDLQLATRAVSMLGEVGEHESEIRRLKEDRRAKVNFDALQAELAEIRDPELDLDALETAMRRFIENPVRPEEGSNPDLQARYKIMVDEVEANLHAITSERLGRLIKDTTKVVETINLETQKFIDQSQYGTALSLVDEAARNFPQADLKPVREKVLSAAEGGWETDKSLAQNLYKDAIAPGVGDQVRAKKLGEAIKVLEHVVANYGKDVREISGYVDEAERLLREYKSRL